MEGDILRDITDSEGLTLKDKHFLDVLFDRCQGDIRRAMDEAGFPKSRPISEITSRLKKHIKDRSRDYLIANSGRAVVSLVEILNDPIKPGVKNIVPAAKEILDRAGIFKEEAPQIIEHRNMFILPPKDSNNEDD